MQGKFIKVVANEDYLILFAGDFNTIGFSDEKARGNLVTNMKIRELGDTLYSIGLEEIPMVGG